MRDPSARGAFRRLPGDVAGGLLRVQAVSQEGAVRRRLKLGPRSHLHQIEAEVAGGVRNRDAVSTRRPGSAFVRSVRAEGRAHDAHVGRQRTCGS
jgi:hypothetical protein